MDAGRIESAIEAMGFEVVSLDRGGGRNRPLVRIRIDRPDSPAGRSGVTVEDCAIVSRGLRELLETEGEDASSWVLEVSSPGIERPLVKARDYARFVGQRVRVRGFGPLASGRKQLEGTLLGLVEERPGAFALEVGGERFEIPIEAVATARLVYDWDSHPQGEPDRARR